MYDIDFRQVGEFVHQENLEIRRIVHSHLDIYILNI